MEPELGQRREKDGEIPSTVGGKKSGYVLNEDPATVSEKSVGDPCELEEEAGAVSCKSSAASGDGEVLAGESSEEEINVCPGIPFSGSLARVSDIDPSRQ